MDDRIQELLERARETAATAGEYAKATGLECLFGALFLTGQTARINELFESTMEAPNAL